MHDHRLCTIAGAECSLVRGPLKSNPAMLWQVEIQEKSKAVVVGLSDQAAVTDQALLAAMNELESPATFVRRDIHKTQ